MTDQQPKIPTVALIDVAGIFRANLAVQPDHTAVDRTLARVRSLRSQYDHCAVCVDLPPYRRAQLSPSYKGQREAIGAVGRELYAKTKQALVDDGIAVLGAEGYEADDIMATLTAQLCARPVGKQVSVVVVSADKDMAQLVNDERRVTLLNWSKDVLLDETGVRAVFGVPPSKVRDLLALTGDTSDNIEGVRGVGAKTAALVVNSGPGLDGALAGEFIKNITANIADKIASARETVLLARKLVTLETDAPVSAEEIFVKREPKRESAPQPPPQAPRPVEQPRAKPVAPPPMVSTQVLSRVEAPRVELAPAQDWGIGVPVEHLLSRVDKIKEVQSKVMKKGHHYGSIPGTKEDRLCLLKPGAEILTLTFQLDPQFKLEELRDGDHLESLVTCMLYHYPTGARVGSGVGSCSTRESKYAWRKGERRCPRCNQTAIIKGKEEYGGGWVCFAKKGGCGAKFGDHDPLIASQSVERVANPDLADCWNTVRKMACKRAHVAAILFTTGASELFTQDVEDNDEPTAQDDWETYYRQQQRGAA